MTHSVKQGFPRSWRDLLPWSTAIENLEGLLLDALELPKELDRLQASWNGPVGNRDIAGENLRQFRDRVIERSEFISHVRSARILRDAIPPARIFGAGLDVGVAFEPLRGWVNGVIGNIDAELQAIERQQIMWVTLAAVLIALFAASVATISAVCDLSNWLKAR
jgi:hypothetical protein